MRLSTLFILVVAFFLGGCASPTPAPSAVPLAVQYTPAAIPWLAALYTCAGSSPVTADQRAAEYQDLRSADLAIRLGQPDLLVSPAYQVGSDDLLVIVNPQNPLTRLTADQVRGLFTGQIVNWKEAGGSDTAVQVWVYSPADDLQVVFDQAALDRSPVTSNARLASGPADMLRAIAANEGAVGILNRRLLSGSVADIFTVSTLPVLAITRTDPPAGAMSLIACMQK